MKNNFECNKIVTVGLKSNIGKLYINKTEYDEDAAELWEVNENSTVNNNLTCALSHINFPEVELIYEKSTGNLLMYNILLDMKSKETKLFVELTGDITAYLDDDIEESLKLVGVNRVDTDGDKVFATPTYEVVDSEGKSAKVILWLNKYGHRLNQLHISYI